MSSAVNCGGMQSLIREVLAVWMAIIVASSLFLTPANAELMVDCEQFQSAVSQHHDHAGHGHDDNPAGYDGMAFHHPEVPCSSHVCVTAMDTPHLDASEYGAWRLANRNSAHPSLAELAVPDDLLRPPRF